MFDSNEVKHLFIHLPNLRRAGDLHKPLSNADFSNGPLTPPPSLILAIEISTAEAWLHVVDSLDLCSVPEIANLRVERTLEGRPRGAAVDVGGEALFACDDVGVLQDSQHGRHH